MLCTHRARNHLERRGKGENCYGPSPSGPLSLTQVRERDGEREDGINPYRFLPFFCCASPVIGTKRTGRTVSLRKLPSFWRV